MAKEQKCDFFLCPYVVARFDSDRAGMQFCVRHEDEILGYARGGDLKPMMLFWVRSQGGAPGRVERAMLNGES